MKRLLLLVSLTATVMLVAAPAALAQQGGGLCPDEQFPNPATAPGDPGEGTLDCFATEEGAEIYSLTGVNVNVPDSSPITARGAEVTLTNEGGTCPEGFVTTNAGICAEESPTTPGRILGYGEPPAEEQPAEQPQQQDDQMMQEETDEEDMAGGALPDTGGPALLLPVAGLLVGSGMFGLLAVRRRTS